MQLPFAKKSLGQNFLNSDGALADIISASAAGEGDEILEIGPGRGALTKALLKTGARVTAIEKDEALVSYLKELFQDEIDAGQFHIIEGDVLEFDLASYVSLIKKPYKLIANIPYYITGQIFRMFLESNYQPSSLTMLVQKEVAVRAVARDGKEGILSMSVKAYGKPRIVSTVKRGSFFPIPNVDSAILHISDVSKAFFIEHGITEEAFFKVVKTAFAHKRKTITSNLKEIFDDVISVCEACSISPKSRAEDLVLADFAHLASKLSKSN